MKRILVLKERWCLIGEWHDAIGDKPAYLTDASCIRTWGTTAGLGEIAMTGPTPSTNLDFCGTVIIERESLLFSLVCAFGEVK